MNIRLRLILWYTAILFLILLIFSLAVYIGLSRSLLLTVDNHLQREVGEILGNLKFETPDDDEDEWSDEHESQAEVNLELKYTPEEGSINKIAIAYACIKFIMFRKYLCPRSVYLI